MTAWLRYYLSKLFAAWRVALIAGLPAAVRRLFGVGERLEILCSEPMTARKVLADGRSIPVRIDRIGRRFRRQAVLVAPGELVLKRDMELPRAALTKLDEVVRLDTPISTPFEASEIFLAAAPRERIGPDRIRVVVAMAIKEAISPWIDKARGLGVVPARLWLAEGLTVDLDPAAAARRHAALRLDLLLAALAVALALTLGSVVETRQAAAVDDVREQISTTVKAVEHLEALRRETTSLQARLAFLSARKPAAPSMLAEFGAMASALPPELRLTSLSITETDATVGLAARDGAAPADAIDRFARTLYKPGYTLAQDPGSSSILVKGNLIGASGGTQ